MAEFATKITDLLSGVLESVDVSIKLGVIGGLIILVLFFIAWAISAGSKIDGYRKKLIACNKKLNEQPPITDENVDVVFNELESHPEEVKQGWKAFLDQRVGYPSDYITSKEVLSKREFSGKGAAAKVFFGIVGAIVWAFVALVGFGAGLANELSTAANVIKAIEFIVIPVAMYVICLLLLDIIFNRKIRRLSLAFTSFCEMLDGKIVVADADEKEFVSDNLEEINRRVEELIAGRTASDRIIEVISAPAAEKSEEVQSLEEIVEEESEPEEVVVKEEPEPAPAPVQLAEMTTEQKDIFFEALVGLVDQAIADETCTEEDYALIAAAIYDKAEETGAINNPADMEVFEACFELLAAQVRP